MSMQIERIRRVAPLPVLSIPIFPEVCGARLLGRPASSGRRDHRLRRVSDVSMPGK